MRVPIRRLGLLLFLLLCVACGGTGGVPAPSALLFDSPPEAAASVVVRTFDARGDLLDGPRTLPLAPQVELGPVSPGAVRLHLEYRQDDQIVAVGEEPLNGDLRQPQYVPLSEIRRLLLDAEAERLPAGAPRRLRALGLLEDGRTVDLTPSVRWTQEPTAVTAEIGDLRGTSSIEESSVRPVELLPVPAQARLPIGSRLQVRVLARFEDGTVLDVTRAAAATVSGSAFQGPGALVTATKVGEGALRLDWSGLSVHVPLSAVQDPVDRLEVGPARAHSPLGLRQPFRAVAVFADGFRLDVSEGAEWSGEVDGAGVAWCRTPGDRTVRVSWGGREAAANLTIDSAPLSRLEIHAVPRLPEAPVRVVGHDAAGRAWDVTDQAQWTGEGAWVSPLVHGVVARAEGEATVTARLAGLEAEAPIGAAAVTLVSVAIEPPQPRLVVGTLLPVRAVGTWSDGSTSDVTATALFSVADSAVARAGPSQDWNGVVRALGAGSTTLQVNHASGKSATVPLEVVQANLVDLSVSPPDAVLAAGTAVAFRATGVFDDGTVQDLTRSAAWSTSVPGVATVTGLGPQQGVVVGAAPGSAQVRASFGGLTAVAPVSVSAALVTSLQVSPPNVLLAPAEELSMRAIGRFTDSGTVLLTERVVWSSSDPSVLSVSNADGARGRVMALAPGTATVLARDVDSGVEVGVPATVTGSALVSLAITPAPLDLPSGRRAELTATGTFADGSERDLTLQVGWTSSDPTRVAVGNSAGSRGVVQALAPGPATVTARHPGSGVAATAAVQATSAALLRVDLAPVGLALPLGVPYPFDAQGRFTDGRMRSLAEDGTWSSSDPGIATVENTAGSRGVVRGVAPGTATLTVTDPGTGMSALAPLTVTTATLESVALSPTSFEMLRGRTQQFEARGVFSDGTVLRLTDLADWSSSAPATAPVDGGLASALAPGGATLTAEFGGRGGATDLTVFDIRPDGALTVGNWSAMEPARNGARLYAADLDSDCLIVYDADRNAEVARLPVQTNPSCLAVSPDGRQVLVGHSGSPALTLVDVEALTVRTIAGASTRTHTAVAVGGDGRGYVMDTSGYLEVLDLAAGTVLWTGRAHYSGSALALDPARNLLYVGDTEGDTEVRRYSVAGATPVLQGSAVLGRTLRRLGLTPDGVGLICLGRQSTPGTPATHGIGLFSALDLALQGFVPGGLLNADWALSSDSRRFFLLLETPTAIRVDSLPGRRLIGDVAFEFSQPYPSFTKIALTADGRFLLVCGRFSGAAGELLRFRVE